MPEWILRGFLIDEVLFDTVPAEKGVDRLIAGLSDVFRTGVPLRADWRARIEAAEALGAARDPRLPRPTGADYWVAVPGGEFTMGAQKENRTVGNFDVYAGEGEAVRDVTVAGFELGRFPVTVEEYGAFVAEGGDVPEAWEEQTGHSNRPVTGVNRGAAEAYCRWIGGRLPSEEEWEYAARFDDGRKYPWGNEPADEERWNGEGRVGAPSPVGVFARGNSKLGLSDMAGNVLEWTSSAWDAERAVLKGGAWPYGKEQARCAARFSARPEERYPFIGFRCARDAPRQLDAIEPEKALGNVHEGGCTEAS